MSDRALRRYRQRLERARMRRLLVERMGWGREPTLQELAKFSAVSPKPCGGSGRCPWCDGNATASTRRRLDAAQVEVEL